MTYTDRVAQKKLAQFEDDLFMHGIRVKLIFTEKGIEISGPPVDVLLAKKWLKEEGITVA